MININRWFISVLLSVVLTMTLWNCSTHADNNASNNTLEPWRCYTLVFESARASLFTHWELIQPVSPLRASSTPKTYFRNTVDPSALNYEYKGKSYPLTHYLRRANISGFMVLADGQIRLEYYGKGLTPESRNHIWSASKSYTAILIGMAVYDGTIESLIRWRNMHCNLKVPHMVLHLYAMC